MMSPKKPAAHTYELSWLTFAKALWNVRALAVVVALVFSFLGATVVYRLPARYRSEALILVDSQKIPERFVATTVTAEVQDRLTTISQEILSSTRLTKTIQDFNLYHEERNTHVQEEIIEMMRKDIEVKVEKPGGGGRPGAFRISYQGSNPVTVAQVTNRIANLYIEENLRAREVQAEGTSEFVTHQLDEAKKQLDQLEASVSQYKLQHNGELPQQEDALQGALARLQAELTGVQDALNRAEQTKLFLQNSLSVGENTETLLSQRMQRPARQSPDSAATVPVVSVSRPVTSVEQLTAQLNALRMRYGPEHPEIRRVTRELERARAAEQATGRDLRPPSASAHAPAASAPAVNTIDADTSALIIQRTQAGERNESLRAQLGLAERDIARNQAERARILRDIALYQSRVERLPIREQEMAALTRDYEMSKSNYRSLLDKKVAAEMASELERRQKAERFTILDPARVPERPFKPNRPVLYVGCIGGGIVLGIVLAIGTGLMRNLLLGEWELPADVPLLGRVPHMDFPATVAAVSGEQSGGDIAHHWNFPSVNSAVRGTPRA